MIFVVLIAVFVVIAVLASKAQKRAQELRRQQMSELGRRLGFQCLPFGLPIDQPKGFLNLFGSQPDSPTEIFLAQFVGFQPFGVGHSYKPGPVLFGERSGAYWYVFDYEYKITTSNGKTTTTTTYNVSVVAARPPFLLPQLQLSQENFFTHIGEMLGMQDVHFESEDFNKRYRVKCANQKAAFDILNPQAIDYLLHLPPRPWQMAMQWVLIAERRLVEMPEYLRVVEDIEGFLNFVPEYYRRDNVGAPFADPLAGRTDSVEAGLYSS